jgi:hypothetical protein
MPDTIELEIPTAIEAAAKRAGMAVDSHYLPAQLNADLNVLIRAALFWDTYEKYEKQTRKP